MPLVIVVMIVILIFVSAAEASKKKTPDSSLCSKTDKTYAELEIQLFEKYRLSGKEPPESYVLMQAEMKQLGFVPIIPSNYFYTTSDRPHKFPAKEIYNSEIVQVRRLKFFKKWIEENKELTDKYGNIAPPVPTIEDIYDNWPETDGLCKKEISDWHSEHYPYPVGTYIKLSNNEVGQIISIGKRRMFYKVKMIDSGKIKSVFIYDEDVKHI